MKRILLAYGLLIIFPVLAFGQPQHVGALANFQFEGSGSGNGTIAGLEIQNVEHLRIFGQPLKVVSNATFTLDKKVYRNQFGGAIRATSVARLAAPGYRVLFAQAGVQVGGIAFPGTPGTSDGYAKYIVRPVVGGGVDVTRDQWSLVVDYQLHFKRKLYSQKPQLSDFRNRAIDGWSSGQRVGVVSTVKVTERWMLLINGAAGWYTYQRNPATYGAQLGSVVHRFNAYEFSIGIGRKYGKQS